MSNIKRLFFLATCLLTLNFRLLAAEGMYPPDQIPTKIKGLKVKPADIYQPDGGGLAGAVLLFGGGTGSFVSADGLVLTNHHVAFGAIQKNSTDEQNYLAQGFYARTKADELPAPGYEASLMIGFEDITEKILKSFTPQMTPEERTRALERAIAQLEAESEDSANGLTGRVVAMLDGASYYL
ncbi:MAG TPA: S46 family peptidase, partial [Candidatus Marinimicrobia bacterium]|nr:S46 family peptidase [Candidatus Neomarinimicrobiota bacterium]